MYLCVSCGALTELDDAEVPTATGRCFCVYCLRAVTHDERRVSKRLQREIATVEDDLRGMKLPVDGRLLRLREGLE